MSAITIPTPVYSQGVSGTHRLMMTPSRQFFWNDIEPNQVFDDVDTAIRFMRDELTTIWCDVPKYRYRGR